MKSDDERRATREEFRRIDTAFRAGDLDALCAALGNADDFPNTLLPLASFGPGGACLEYAIYHSPLPFIRALLELGADPNPPEHVHIGFPLLIAALSCVRSPTRISAGSTTDALAHGAERSLDAVRILLAGGADPVLRTRIDDCLTAREEAERAGLREIGDLLAAHEARREGAQ